MQISQRLILGFLAVAMWVGVVGHISLFQLTKMDKIINQALDKAEETDREIFSNLDKANLALVQQAQNLIKTSRWLVLIFVIVALILAVGSGLVISRSIYKPLLQMKAATAKIGRGKLDTRIEIKSHDEIGQLAASFKKMVTDLNRTTTSIDNLNLEIAERKKAEENVRHAYKKLEKTNHELKEMHIQLVQNEKLAAIGQLAAGVAHEMNTPVGFVASNFQTLENYVKKIRELLETYDELIGQIETSEISELLDKAEAIEQARQAMKIDFVLEDLPVLFDDSREGLQRVTNIIQSLKDFSRIDQPGSRDEYDINNGIEATLVVAGNEIKYDADIKTEFSEVPPILCNSGQINQVFLNILVNAAQAIKSQEREGMGTITIKTYAADSEVICEISDDGPGIAPDKLPKIFDPFFTTKPAGKGTGLGLSVSYDIIANKHNGKLLVDSTVGEGTKFTIKLPISKKEPNNKQGIEDNGKEKSVICGR